MATAEGWNASAPGRIPVARRIVAATCVMFAALAGYLASGTTVAAVRAAPLALTAPLDGAGAAGSLTPALHGATPRPVDVATDAGATGIAAIAPEGPVLLPPVRTGRVVAARVDAARAGLRSLHAARAPPLEG